MRILIFIILEIVGINADVWIKISSNVSVDLVDKVTPASIRMHVARNNGKLLQTLGLVPLTKPCSENRQIDESSMLK